MADNPFTSGNIPDLVPEGDAARQAVDSLRGYAYQVLASALAWVDLGERDRLYLEVAEDYAVMAQNLSAVQVKDTAASATVTLNSSNVHEAIGSFVDLVARNPGVSVELRYLTTSTIGVERRIADRPGGIAGLEYWRKAAVGSDVAPLRAILESEAFLTTVRDFVRARNDAELRLDLLQKIHWDCGAPDFQTLHDDLQERLIVVGRDRFSLAAPDARRLADVVAYRVMRKSVLKTSDERVLKRAELYEILNAAAEVALPRATALALLSQLATGMAGSIGEGLGPASTLEAQEPGWLISSDSLPSPRRLIARPALESAVSGAVDQFGAAILVGASGLGKSHVARVAAELRPGAFVMVDLRDVDAAEMRRRLDIVFGRIGGMNVPLLILEDLNLFDDPGVARALGRVLEALHRRDRTALVTCYRKPSVKAAAAAGMDLRGTVECTYFTEEEAHELVTLYGGDAAQWGRLAFAAGAAGHPQLTHAFVVGMSARGWPRSEIPEIISRGISTSDIDSAREAARRSLIDSLPESARNLLYRLSLAVGHFSRRTALVVGNVPPPISQAGENIDLIVGPWIEAIGPERYRISPLASGFGRSQLSPGEQAGIHEAIAIEMLSGGKIDAGDADTIFVHAFVAKSPFCLMKLAMGVLTARVETLPLLAESLTFFQLVRTDNAILPEFPIVAIMLRLAQFKLRAAGGKNQEAAIIAGALLRELSALQEVEELKKLSEMMVLGTVLSTMGVADYLDDWLSLLRRFKEVLDSGKTDLGTRFQDTAKGLQVEAFGALFWIGASRVATVARLEHVIDELAKLEPRERADWLTFDPAVSDYAILINGPWATEQRRKDFDANDAVARYGRMAEKTKDWRIESLTIQCWIARGVILDEYMSDADAALRLLDEAVSLFGERAVLLRAKAKIYWRRDDHPKALAILRRIADEVGEGNTVERAFALREAAISAAKCDDWSLAREWFAEAKRASGSSQTEDMQVMALGLGADAAVAALMDGDARSALRGLADALEGLCSVDPNASLPAAYAHRVIRHAVLWALNKTGKTDIKISGKAIAIVPGCCSNPEPLPSVADSPLAPLDSAWYLLAEAEIAAGIDEGIADGLSSRLAGGEIPLMECSLRALRIRNAIKASETESFIRNLQGSLDALAFLATERVRQSTNFDPTNPPRGKIPPCDVTSALAERTAADAILAFGMRAAFAGRNGKLRELQSALRSTFGKSYPGNTLCAPEGSVSPELNRTILAMLQRLDEPQHVEPQVFWMIGLRFFEQIGQSGFKVELEPLFAQWFRAGWTRIVRDETFRLTRPAQTVPPISAVLANPDNNRSFLAALLLAASEAVGSRLSAEYSENLRVVARAANEDNQTQ
jgi:hypothetical protein